MRSLLCLKISPAHTGTSAPVPTCSDMFRPRPQLPSCCEAHQGSGCQQSRRAWHAKTKSNHRVKVFDKMIYRHARLYNIYILCIYYRRKFRSQTSDNMERWKAEQGRGTEKRKIRREKIRRERVRGQKIQMREKVGKSRNTVFFQWFVAQEGRKVGSLKRRVRSQLATGAMKNCTPLWREAHFQVKMYKTPGVDHFWKLRCRKSARRCGAKHISKSKCTKHTRFGPLLEVAMPKKCTPLWREAHFQVKMCKTHQVRTTFGSCDAEKVHAVVARSTFPSQKC